MTTHGAQLNQLNQNHDAIMSQMKSSQDATKNLINNSSAQADALLKAGKHQEAADAMSKMMDGVQAQQKTKWQDFTRSSASARKIVETPVATSSEASKSLLPQGISKGKIAAIAAGVAVVGGGILLYRNHQQKKRESWAARIEQERMNTPQRGISY